MSIIYLVAATLERGIADAAERGWERIAMARFATPAKDDIRVIRRYTDLLPMAGKTPMLKGGDYDSGPDNDYLLEGWVREKERFDQFVTEGHGVWVDGP